MSESSQSRRRHRPSRRHQRRYARPDIQDLPDEILLDIFDRVDTETLDNLRKTSRRMYQIADTPTIRDKEMRMRREEFFEWKKKKNYSRWATWDEKNAGLVLNKPEDLLKLTGYVSIELDDYWEIPESIVGLENISHLHLRGLLPGTKIPRSIAGLKIWTLELEKKTNRKDILKLPSNYQFPKTLRTLLLHGIDFDGGQLPSSIRNLSYLKKLHIRDSKVELPEWFGELTNLQYLDLTGTQITTLPYTFGNLKKLKEVILPNELINLPEDLSWYMAMNIPRGIFKTPNNRKIEYSRFRFLPISSSEEDFSDEEGYSSHEEDPTRIVSIRGQGGDEYVQVCTIL